MNVQKGDKVAYIVTGTVAQVHLMPGTKEPYIVFEGNEKSDLFCAESLAQDECVYVVRKDYMCYHRHYKDIEKAKKDAAKYNAKVYQVFHKEVT